MPIIGSNVNYNTSYDTTSTTSTRSTRSTSSINSSSISSRSYDPYPNIYDTYNSNMSYGRNSINDRNSISSRGRGLLVCMCEEIEAHIIRDHSQLEVTNNLFNVGYVNSEFAGIILQDDPCTLSYRVICGCNKIWSMSHQEFRADEPFMMNIVSAFISEINRRYIVNDQYSRSTYNHELFNIPYHEVFKKEKEKDPLVFDNPIDCLEI